MRHVVVFQVNNCLHHDVEILCLTTLDMLIQTVLIIIDRSALVLVRFRIVGVNEARLENWGLKELHPSLTPLAPLDI
jgi:hypothetical protein